MPDEIKLPTNLSPIQKLEAALDSRFRKHARINKPKHRPTTPKNSHRTNRHIHQKGKTNVLVASVEHEHNTHKETCTVPLFFRQLYLRIWTRHKNPWNYSIYHLFHTYWHQVNGGNQIAHEEQHFELNEFNQWDYPCLRRIPSCVLNSAVDVKKTFLVLGIINVSCDDPLQPTPNGNHVKTGRLKCM
jgi:hypothetical protein